MNCKSRLLRRVQEDADDDDDDDDDNEEVEEDENGDDRDDERGDDEGILRNTVDFAGETRAAVSTEVASSGRRVAARDSRAGEEDWTKRKKQNKTSKAEAERQKKSERRPRAERVKAGLRGRK